MKKQIVSETKQYQPSFPDALLLDDTPKVNSFNGVTSDGVARAVAGASGEVPVVTENDNGKVLKAIYDEGGPAVEWGEATVDQTYDATSTNAQSGVAVAGALATVNQVPASTSDDADKVLTVNAQGAPEWATAQGGGGGASYTAGTGITIDSSNAIGVSTYREAKTPTTHVSGTYSDGYMQNLSIGLTATKGIMEVANNPVTPMFSNWDTVKSYYALSPVMLASDVNEGYSTSIFTMAIPLDIDNGGPFDGNYNGNLDLIIYNKSDSSKYGIWSNFVTVSASSVSTSAPQAGTGSSIVSLVRYAYDDNPLNYWIRDVRKSSGVVWNGGLTAATVIANPNNYAMCFAKNGSTGTGTKIAPNGGEIMPMYMFQETSGTNKLSLPAICKYDYDGQVAFTGPIPSFSAADSGKVLSVNSSGKLAWVTH